MKALYFLLALCVLPIAAQAEKSLKDELDCTTFQGVIDPEAVCFSEARRSVNREFNAQQIRQAGLEFLHMERPPIGEAFDKAYPEAKKVLEDEVDGEFLITFSVNKQGLVEGVKIRETSSAPIKALAVVWADAIAQWRFVKPAKVVKDVSFRRLYLFAEKTEGDKAEAPGNN